MAALVNRALPGSIIPMRLPATAEIAPFVNKSVDFRFRGMNLSFRLSHGLFSSFDIDEGTRLLLKSIAQRIDLAGVGSALDVGCGVGIIGACIRSQAEGAHVLMQDRDALAAAFAHENCRVNGLEGVAVDCNLAFWGLGGRRFDLVTSNIPAKAGAPVLESFFRHAAGCLSIHGTAAVVIVSTLAKLAHSVVDALGCEVLYEEDGRGYSVVHFRAGRAAPESDRDREDLSPYIRTRAGFSRAGVSYSLQTAHSLPDFDTLGHALELSLDLLSGIAVRGSVLAWNPGQGHLPVWLLSRPGSSIGNLILASRDILECAVTERNMLERGAAPDGVLAACSEGHLRQLAPEASYDLLCAAVHPVPRVPWQADLSETARALLKPGGKLFLVGTSTEMHRFLDAPKGLKLRESRKRMGCRAALLEKP